MIVTIDGPAGSGKSSVAAEVAKVLNFIHLNSGSLYRALAQQASLAGINWDDEPGLVALAGVLDFSFAKGDFRSALCIFNRESGEEIDVSSLANERWAKGASEIGVLPKVREALTAVQRSLGESYDLVLEGRDAGTVVFPNAEFKFYLDAPLEERARRRTTQLLAMHRQEHGDGAADALLAEDAEDVYQQVLADMRDRDARDSSREHSPQQVPSDAVRVDTAEQDIKEVVQYLSGIVTGGNTSRQ